MNMDPMPTYEYAGPRDYAVHRVVADRYTVDGEIVTFVNVTSVDGVVREPAQTLVVVVRDVPRIVD